MEFYSVMEPHQLELGYNELPIVLIIFVWIYFFSRLLSALSHPPHLVDLIRLLILEYGIILYYVSK